MGCRTASDGLAYRTLISRPLNCVDCYQRVPFTPSRPALGRHGGSSRFCQRYSDQTMAAS